MTTPRACTLPTEERPVRLAEFELLFSEHLRRVARTGDRSAVFHLTGGDSLLNRVRDLADRESSCCSFFSFEIAQPEPSDVTLRVGVPRRYRNVLRALADRAEQVAR
jgi:hypothetical protein